MEAPDTRILWKLWQGRVEPACQRKWGSLTFFTAAARRAAVVYKLIFTHLLILRILLDIFLCFVTFLCIRIGRG